MAKNDSKWNYTPEEYDAILGASAPRSSARATPIPVAATPAVVKVEVPEIKPDPVAASVVPDVAVAGKSETAVPAVAKAYSFAGADGRAQFAEFLRQSKNKSIALALDAADWDHRKSMMPSGDVPHHEEPAAVKPAVVRPVTSSVPEVRSRDSAAPVIAEGRLPVSGSPAVEDPIARAIARVRDAGARAWEGYTTGPAVDSARQGLIRGLNPHLDNMQARLDSFRKDKFVAHYPGLASQGARLAALKEDAVRTYMTAPERYEQQKQKTIEMDVRLKGEVADVKAMAKNASVEVFMQRVSEGAISYDPSLSRESQAAALMKVDKTSRKQAKDLAGTYNHSAREMDKEAKRQIAYQKALKREVGKERSSLRLFGKLMMVDAMTAVAAVNTARNGAANVGHKIGKVGKAVRLADDLLIHAAAGVVDGIAGAVVGGVNGARGKAAPAARGPAGAMGTA